MGKNIFNAFRRVLDPGEGYEGFSKRYDEPSYLTFRLKFGDGDNYFNKASQSNLSDLMPHPLFNNEYKTSFPPDDDAQVADPINIAPINDMELPRPDMNVMSSRGLNLKGGSAIQKRVSPTTTSTAQFSLINDLPTDYSAVRYLLEANEPTRAYMLMEFIDKFNSLQEDFSYYFQEIEGITDLLKIDTTKGQRVLSDQKITITCLEGLDLRLSYLMSLYRKIVWDDIYQRWVLPDMMRYFTLKIYLAEFRTFHTPFLSNPGPTPNNEQKPLFLSILDGVLPTWEITCEMCEFDIAETTFDHLAGLKVNSDPQMAGVKLVIKVGNIRELQIYPEFAHMFLSDKALNSSKRAGDTVTTLGDVNSQYMYPTLLQVAQNREAGSPENDHVSGLPYNENANSDSMFGVYNPGPTPNQVPESWVGNAINFGKAFASGFVNKYIDKAKMTDVPGLGVSFTETMTALESKNVISVLGLIRKGISDTVNSYSNGPSSRLESSIETDKLMKDFLSNVASYSEATDPDTKILQTMANIALNDQGIWQSITDYSMATDLIGFNNSEINDKNKIEKAEIIQTPAKPPTILSPVSPIVLPNAASKSGLSSTPVIDEGVASSHLNATEVPAQININAIKTTKIEIGQVIEFPPTSSFAPIQGATSMTQPAPSSTLSEKIEK